MIPRYLGLTLLLINLLLLTRVQVYLQFYCGSDCIFTNTTYQR